MEKIITIDKNARIKIIAENFMLQYRIKSRNNRIVWHTDGFFTDLKYLSKEYINNAPYRTIQGTEGLKKLIEVIKTAEANLCKAIEIIDQ